MNTPLPDFLASLKEDIRRVVQRELRDPSFLRLVVEAVRAGKQRVPKPTPSAGFLTAAARLPLPSGFPIYKDGELPPEQTLYTEMLRAYLRLPEVTCAPTQAELREKLEAIAKVHYPRRDAVGRLLATKRRTWDNVISAENEATPRLYSASFGDGQYYLFYEDRPLAPGGGLFPITELPPATARRVDRRKGPKPK